MAKIIQLKWTELQREIAAGAQAGKTFDELVEMGYTKSLVSKVLRAIKSGQKLPEQGELRTENQEPSHKAAEKPSGIPGTPIIVGKITITPENWGMTQEGAILILDTYNKTKRDLNYGGTIGDFLCDVCTFYRRVLNYQEVEYVRATASEGGGGVEEDGDKSLEPAIELAKGQ